MRPLNRERRRRHSTAAVTWTSGRLYHLLTIYFPFTWEWGFDFENPEIARVDLATYMYVQDILSLHVVSEPPPRLIT